MMLTFISFRTMVALGMLFPVLGFWVWWRRKDPLTSPRLLRVLPWVIPLSYIAIQLGWIVTEL